MKKAYLFLADGFEEIEALTPVDVLRRGQVEVVTVSTMEREEVCGSHGIVVAADKVLKKSQEAKEFLDADLIILPGGLKGTNNLAEKRKVAEIIEAFAANNKLLAAICAGPSIYGRMGLLDGKDTTCYPGFEKYMPKANYTGDAVTVDGNFITARGMGVSLQFALKLLETLTDKDTADKLAKEIQS